MNLRLTKVSDVAKELQTDELKMKIYSQIEKFVYKYQQRYYPHFTGDLHDLVMDFFTKFITPQKHRNGKVFSELDRVEPGKVGGGEWKGTDDKAIATYTQRYTIARLIDCERKDKHEVRASENFDDKNPTLTLDRAASGNTKNSKGDDGMVGGAYTEDINYQFYDLMDNPQAIKNARKSLLNNPDQVKRIKYLAKHYDDKLDPEVKEFIKKLIGEDEEVEPVATSSEAQTEVSNLLGESVKITNYKLHKKPAIKLTFPDKDAMNAAEEHKSAVIDLMDKDGYSFYKAHGSTWYFFKKSEVGDSLIEDDNDLPDFHAVTDASSKERFDSLANRVGDKPQHYLNQINRCGPTKKIERLQTFYKLAKEEGFEQTAKAIKEKFPEEYSPEEIKAEKDAQEKIVQEKKVAERKAAKERAEQAKQEAIKGGPTYCNVDTTPGTFMSSPNNIFTRFAKKHPKGFVVEVTRGDLSVGAPWEGRDGRVWTLANKYTVKSGDKSKVFDIANLTNEGYNPDSKTGWETDRHGKKRYVGASFGWLLNGRKMKFSELKKVVESELAEF